MSDRRPDSLADDTAAMRAVAESRWPDGVRCPHCASPRVAARSPQPGRTWPQWRCSDCRRDFTALTGHPQHARSRRRPTLIAADIDADNAGTQARNDPLAGLTAGTCRVLAVLRRRPHGATASRIVGLSGLSASHTRRTLRCLADRGWARRHLGTVRDGHRLRGAALWQIVHSDDCLAALAALPAQSFPMPPLPQPDMVPPEFWHLFWSGLEGSELRISQHAEHIGGGMIGSNDISAEAWALLHLPTDALTALARSRSRHDDPSGRLLAATVQRRTSADA